jgi:hypothetical protein
MASHASRKSILTSSPVNGRCHGTKPGEPGYAFLLAPSPAAKAAGCTQTRPVERGKERAGRSIL